MKVYWVSEIFDTDDVDIDSLRLFQTEKQAQDYADELDSKRFIAWEKNEDIRKARWERDQMIVEALEKIGIAWKESFPWHKTTWQKHTFGRKYVVRSLEVETIN